MVVMQVPAKTLAETYDRPAECPSSRLGIAGADRCGIGFHIRPGAEIGRPAVHYLGHAFGRDAQLRLRYTAIDAFMIGRNQPVPEHEPAEAVDHHFLARELWDRRNEPRKRPGITGAPVCDGVEE